MEDGRPHYRYTHRCTPIDPYYRGPLPLSCASPFSHPPTFRTWGRPATPCSVNQGSTPMKLAPALLTRTCNGVPCARSRGGGSSGPYLLCGGKMWQDLSLAGPKWQAEYTRGERALICRWGPPYLQPPSVAQTNPPVPPTSLRMHVPKTACPGPGRGRP